ncbi:MAG: glycosyltransferase [Gammaproteobacteria bacterium]|nr:glycosyltransferase [Gammaproteobacteria bacterium]MDH3373528.1 glycosyltransferase [Gammaproteobacteria bacterium]MDH3552661.1 glycosyltransferase [Gammaproteobacteria bacterium]
MKIGHICLAPETDAAVVRFATLIEAFDRLTIEQHVLVTSVPLARRLQSRPYVTVGPVVRTAVMAYCLMPNVDLVHIHEERGEQAALLLRLTRSIPFVLTVGDRQDADLNPLSRAVRQRAARLIPQSYDEPNEILATYRQAIGQPSELPQDADCG